MWYHMWVMSYATRKVLFSNLGLNRLPIVQIYDYRTNTTNMEDKLITINLH